MNKMVRRSLFIFGCCLLSALKLQAQEEQPGPPMRGPAAERVERLKKVRLMEVLKLDEEASVRFFSRYSKYQEDLRAFQQERLQTMRKLEELKNTNAPEAEIEKGIQEVRSVDGKFLELRDRHWKELREILSTRQLASYVVFENNFQRYLRELMRDMGRERMGRMQSRGR